MEKKISLTSQVVIEGKEVPIFSFTIGKAYTLYSPVENFTSKVLANNIMLNKIVEEDIAVINDFIFKFQDYTIQNFFDKYDKYHIGSLLLNSEREYEIAFTTLLFNLDTYDKKCVYLTYLISSLSKTNILLVVNSMALSPNSSYRFIKSLQKVVEIVKDISIVHIEDTKLWDQSGNLTINSFKIYDLSQLNINSTMDYINFSIEHYEKTNLTQD